MSRSDLFLKSTYNNFGKKYSKSALLSQVASGEQKMDERHRLEAKEKLKKKNEKANRERITSQKPVTHNFTKNIRTVKPLGNSTVKEIHRITPKAKIGRRKPNNGLAIYYIFEAFWRFALHYIFGRF